MLSHLLIKNYALIEELELTPDRELNIITGETGAGKSIMLGAIGLLLGNRADTRVLYNPEKKCVIEGTFGVSGYAIERIFDEEELDYSNTCIVRREISVSGKSRAFVNDTPVNLETLRRVTSQMMDIHSQHDSVLLGSNEYQLEIVDTYAQNDGLLRTYRSDYQSYRTKRTAYDQLQAEASAMRKEFDYNNFLYEELVKAQLQPDEQETLEQELTILENAEEIKERLQLAYEYLDNAEQSVIDFLKSTVSNLAYISKLSDQYEQLQNRAQSSLIELRDLADEISTEQDRVEVDDTRAETIRERLNLIYQLQTKHQVKDVDGLIALRNELEKKVSKVLNLDDALANAKAQASAAYAQLQISAEALSESRKAVLPSIETEIGSLLHDLGMPNASLRIDAETTKASPTGVDTISFLFSANKGVKPQQLKNVASGGEFSRLMMAIKYILASKRSLPTIVFDEIDTGVSGEIAIKMGNMMRDMARSHQIIAISHLHQIAGQGTAHYFVYKDHSSDKTVSRIKKLTQDERITEIAQMIGGKNPSASALKNAREILKQRQN
ncbi:MULTISPECIES: DNA repair protein RecN [unclassified Spirosoma]|uniref:DNA repair protein RecN n=1 Tax=unclassified Spirosoma TaxID=2621999 RepID=UPI000962970E|nr:MULTISPECIES: DNA repair protein RecN [unclassified Spirosoma]MBN8821187.1 DNA repair protein RecN [Spirosoma sp.]OJW79183.1 MAG: DNA repair protein RecN [Spirosoma sp. 48-14]